MQQMLHQKLKNANLSKLNPCFNTSPTKIVISEMDRFWLQHPAASPRYPPQPPKAAQQRCSCNTSTENISPSWSKSMFETHREILPKMRVNQCQTSCIFFCKVSMFLQAHFCQKTTFTIDCSILCLKQNHCHHRKVLGWKAP